MTEVVNTEIDLYAAKRRRIDSPRHDDTQWAMYPAERVAHQNGHSYIGTKVGDNATAQFGNTEHHHYYPRPEPSSDNFELLLRSLLFDRFDARLRNIRTALAQTCTWLFEHEKFLAWQDDRKIAEHHGFFWIKGKPGSGKSTIMKLAFEQTKRKRSKGVVISYFFNARAPGSLEKSSLGLYRSLTYQIVKAVPALHHAFRERFGLKEKAGIVEDWTIEELQEFILEAIITLDKSQTQIFIDALDEGEEEDIRQMVFFLEGLAQHALEFDVKLRICLSSRHYPYISISHGVEMIVEDQPQHAQDIQQYIAYCLRGDQDERMQGLRDEISRKAEGIFLWLTLVVPMLKGMFDKGASAHTVSTHLESLPSKLDSLFADILAKNLENIDTCVILLQWMLCSARPLGVSELYEAVWYSQEQAHDATFTQCMDIQCADLFLRDGSRGLVELTSSKPPTVQFIHETVRSFLLSEVGLPKIQQQLADNVLGRSHDMLRQTCFTLVQKFGSTNDPHDLIHKARSSMTPIGKLSKVDKVLQTDLKKECPLLCYAVDNLLHHADVAQSQGCSQILFLQDFRSETSEDLDFQAWRILHNCLASYTTQSYTSNVSLCYIAADKNLVSLAGCILSYNPDAVNIRGERYGTPLQAASANSHERMVKFLLEHGANVNLEGGEFNTALGVAIHKQHLQIAAVLLKNGAKGSGNLKKSSKKHKLECDCVFELHGRHFISYNKCGRATLLCVAVQKGNLAIVRLLVQHGVNTNEVGCMGTPLYVSVIFYWSKIFHYLVGVGADSFVDANGRPAILTLAAARGSTDVVEALLAQGHHINSIEDMSRTSSYSSHHAFALQAAAYNGHDQCVRLLLDRGADVNARGGYHGNALEAAIASPLLPSSFNAVVRLLLDRGADVNAQGGHFGTALQVAIYSSRNGNFEALAQTLLERGADINTHGGIFETSLIAAVWVNSEEHVRLLLERGAQINFCTAKRGTALDVACCINSAAIMRLLFEHGGRGAGMAQQHGTGKCRRSSECMWSLNQEKILAWEMAAMIDS